MTIRERLSTIGRALTSQPEKVTKRTKGIGASSFDFFTNNALTNYKTVSQRLLMANEGWVYKNNEVIAKEVATIEFELFSTRIVAGQVELVPITSHPLLDALDRFNEFTSASDGFYVTPSHKNLAGDCFWWVEGQGPNIQNIYILQPDKVELVFGDYQGGQRIIEGYKFETTVDGKRKSETYPAEEIIHFKAPDPNNPYRGKSKVEAIAEAIDTYNLAQEANKNFFKRGMITNFFLTTDKSLTEEQTRSVTQKLNNAYRGATNAFKIMVMSGGLKPEPIQSNSKDTQFIEQMKWLRDMIMSAFGNTPSVIGVVEDVNRANAEAGILNWKRTTVKAEMKSITDTLNEFLVPRFGDNLILGFKDPVPEDRGSKIGEAVQLVNANIITQNEAREDLGYEPVGDEGADMINKPVPEPLRIGSEDELPKSLRNISYKRVFRRNGVYTKLANWQDVKEAARPVAEKIVKSKKKPTPVKKDVLRYHPKFTNEVVMSYYEKQMHVVDAYEQMFENKVKTFIDRVVEKALSQVPEEIADMKQKALINEEEEVLQAVIDFTPILHDTALLAGQQALSLIGDDSPFITKNLRPEIERNVRKFTESMLTTDRDKIVDLIADGIARGESIANIRKQITDTFADYSKMQAERITRTEVLRASNMGTLDAFEQSDVVIGKQWLTAGATDECAQYEGQIEYNMKGNFYSPGNEFQDGDPPIHPNCRCTLLPVLDEEKAYKPETIMQRDILQKKIAELEAQVDKRTKDYRKIKSKYADIKKDQAKQAEYVKDLEELVDERPKATQGD